MYKVKHQLLLQSQIMQFLLTALYATVLLWHLKEPLPTPSIYNFITRRSKPSAFPILFILKMNLEKGQRMHLYMNTAKIRNK